MRSSSRRRAAETHTVVLLHGLGRTKNAMTRLTKALRSEHRHAVSIGYPSRARTIAEHTRWLERALDALPPTQRVSLVTHSLGGIVARGLFADAGFVERVPLHRVVMLAPPNQGASLARLLNRAPIPRVLGPSFRDIASGIPRDLPVPSVPFSIIAGDAGRFRNPLIQGPNDGIVSVEETRLDGAASFQVVPSIHTVIMNHPEAVEETKHFIDAP